MRRRSFFWAAQYIPSRPRSHIHSRWSKYALHSTNWCPLDPDVVRMEGSINAWSLGHWTSSYAKNQPFIVRSIEFVRIDSLIYWCSSISHSVRSTSSTWSWNSWKGSTSKIIQFRSAYKPTDRTSRFTSPCFISPRFTIMLAERTKDVWICDLQGASLDERPEYPLTYAYLIAKHQTTGLTICDECSPQTPSQRIRMCHLQACLRFCYVAKVLLGHRNGWSAGILRINYCR